MRFSLIKPPGVMQKLLTLSAVAIAVSLNTVSAVSLEELAERMESLEKKVTAYEQKYGPLEKAKTAPSRKDAGGQIRMPVPAGAPAQSGYATSEDLDAAFMNEDRAAGPAGGGWWERTSIGGYGELHLNQGDKEQVDFHRWVLFVNHRFTDRIKFFSEFELEHSLVKGNKDEGEVELEQAYVEFDVGNQFIARVGQYLVPVGILNEVHEPETFFGVERNNVEKNILPATWWEAGLGGTKNFDSGLGLDVMLHSGFQINPADGNILNGRQKVAQFNDPDGAVTVRARYNGVPGLSLTAFGQYQNDISAGLGGKDSAWMGGATAIYQNGGFGLRALYAYWNIDSAEFDAIDADEQYGYYIEPSYTFTLGGDHKLGLFGRYEHYEFANGRLNEVDEYRVGVNYWPHPNVVLKADFSYADTADDGKGPQETYNFGMGYSF